MSREYCRHHECQCNAAADLAWMSERLRRGDLLLKALEVHEHDLEVRCRHERMPRRGLHGTAVMAPLP